MTRRYAVDHPRAFRGRINRAWGLALRKSFCRSFDFELQAAATGRRYLLSWASSKLPLLEIFDFVSPNTVEKRAHPSGAAGAMSAPAFRWTAGRALALSRMSHGKRVPPPFQRARAEDLSPRFFPSRWGVKTTTVARFGASDHPSVTESLKDCLREAMDVDGLQAVLARSKKVESRGSRSTCPSPAWFAHAMLKLGALHLSR